MISRRSAFVSIFALALAPRLSHGGSAARSAEPWAEKLIAAAQAQIGVTLSYDPSYRKLSFPGGDVPRSVGVCTDVIIRAYRDAFSIDLQSLVNADMKRHFSEYPKSWGLARADSNIDHRRVPNLRAFLRRRGAQLSVSASAADYLPGDLVTQNLPGNLPHIALVSNTLSADQSKLMVIHNIGGGAQMEDTLFAFDITGHYRFAA